MEKLTRTFGRSELAQQYFPHPQLRHLLDLTRRTFTPAEVQLIYTQLGEP